MSSLKDVARLSGVSSRTVNRVLKNSGRVATETQRRVLEAVETLGYRPNPMAQSLSTGKSLEVNVLIASHDELYMKKMEHFEKVLRMNGYAVSLLFCTGLHQDAGIIEDALETIVLRRPAAVALFSFVPAIMERIVGTLGDADIPYITIDHRDGLYDSIMIDRQQGVYEAIKHLYASGRRRIAYLGYVHDRTRLDGYERAVSELKLSPVKIAIPCQPDGKIDAYVDLLLAGTSRPDAVQVYSDVMAMDVLAGLHRRGVRVPEDIAVVGFDDRSFAALAWPTLTSVAQPNREVGEAAAAVLLAKIQNQAPPQEGWSRALPTRLVFRESA